MVRRHHEESPVTDHGLLPGSRAGRASPGDRSGPADEEGAPQRAQRLGCVADERGAQTESSTYWLITRCGTHRMEMLTIDLPGTSGEGQQALPVFSAREDAGDFLEFVRKDGSSQGRFSVAGAAGGWRIREITRGEFLSLLCGPCAGVGKILLDPLPEVDTELALELMGVSREGFVDHLLGRGSSWTQIRFQKEREGTVTSLFSSDPVSACEHPLASS
jgi:hypothetical protein